AGERGLLPARAVAVENPLPQGAVDDRDGPDQLLGGCLGLPGLDQGAELLDLRPESSLPGLVDLPASLALADVLDRALRVGQRSLSLGSLRLDAHLLQALPRQGGLVA